MRARWLFVAAAGAFVMAFLAAWLGMTAALVLALDPVRALVHLIGA